MTEAAAGLRASPSVLGAEVERPGRLPDTSCKRQASFYLSMTRIELVTESLDTGAETGTEPMRC